MSAVAPEYEIRRNNDDEIVGWLSPEQFDHLRTIRLISPSFTWKDSFWVNLPKLSLGPNTLAGSIKVVVTIPGIDNKFIIMSVPLTHHMLKKPEITMVEATIKGM